MTTTTVAKIEDHEGFGRCGACGRENLRWIATLTDGQTVGVECAKKVIGFRPAIKNFAWIADFTAVAEHIEFGATFVLWQSKNGAETCETKNGMLARVGGVQASWQQRGWVAA